ncbi:MAG: L-threonine 3-dehydrogenase [Treponemataceae bacterium]
MRKILVTGSLGQIGSELIVHLRKLYGDSNVVATDVVKKDIPKVIDAGPFELLDVLDAKKTVELCKKYQVNTIIHLAAILSAVAEKNPQLAYNINMNGLHNMLEIAREEKCQLFVPSSIAAFGPSTPKDKTPQDTIQRPTSMYGVTKVAGELLCDYYFKRYGVDTRGVRFPGLISYETLPGGGTTDYAVDIYYEALKKHAYTCFIKEGTLMDMMYLPDALNAITTLLEADASKLHHRNAFSITAMSFAPETIAAEIKKHIPDFKMSYDVDPVRQSIADSWPNSLDDSVARAEWGWKPTYDLKTMTTDMLEKLAVKLGVPYTSAIK